MRKFWILLPKLFALSLLIFVVLVLLSWLQGNSVSADRRLFYSYLFVLLYTVALYWANRFVYSFLDKRFAADRFSIKRLVCGFLGSFLVSVFVIFLLRIFEEVVVEQRSLSNYLATENTWNFVFAIVITFFITLSIYAFGIYKAYQENKVKEQKLIVGTVSAQFESLKNQIDPHFLFNSLNVLSSLIEEDPESAQRFTTSLSKVYRYVLEQKDKDLVSVSEELSFAKTYMNLLKMRFENSLFYSLPEEIPDADLRVVPLSLQLLLENTVKHNVVSQNRPLHIRIFINEEYLAIENDLQRKQVLEDRKGVGLQNIINRYGILTNRKVLIEESQTVFSVKIPILTRQLQPEEIPLDEDQHDYQQAQKKVNDIKGFYSNLISYAFVIPGLAILNVLTYPKYLWFLYPAAFWGIGLLFHGVGVFNLISFLGSDWEQKKIKQLMDKEINSKWK